MTKVILQIKQLWEETQCTNGLGHIYLIKHDQSHPTNNVCILEAKLVAVPYMNGLLDYDIISLSPHCFSLGCSFPPYICVVYSSSNFVPFVLHFLYYTSKLNLALTCFSSFTIHAWFTARTGNLIWSTCHSYRGSVLLISCTFEGSSRIKWCKGVGLNRSTGQVTACLNTKYFWSFRKIPWFCEILWF